MKTVITRRAWLAPLAAALLLSGCGTLSDVSREGATDNPVFPDPQDVSLLSGTYPNVDDLAQVKDGMTRDQLYDLLGRPHFSEGFRVREWDYLFHFRTADGIRTCQFKVLFDKDKIARSFHWAPQDCRPGEPKQTAAAPQKYTLGSDVSFGFGSATLTAAGQQRVAEIATQLRSTQRIEQLEVTGHTDRIGSDAANDALSQQRAQAVRQSLIANGVPGDNVRAVGYGKRLPLVQCGAQPRSELIACLAPNRRVDIQASGTR